MFTSHVNEQEADEQRSSSGRFNPFQLFSLASQN